MGGESERGGERQREGTESLKQFDNLFLHLSLLQLSKTHNEAGKLLEDKKKNKQNQNRRHKRSDYLGLWYPLITPTAPHPHNYPKPNLNPVLTPTSAPSLNPQMVLWLSSLG